jgi:hypothetical protein
MHCICTVNKSTSGNNNNNNKLESVVLTSSMKVDELVSMSSSLPILVKICRVILKDAYSAGTKEPIWAMI